MVYVVLCPHQLVGVTSHSSLHLSLLYSPPASYVLYSFSLDLSFYLRITVKFFTGFVFPSEFVSQSLVNMVYVVVCPHQLVDLTSHNSLHWSLFHSHFVSYILYSFSMDLSFHLSSFSMVLLV